MSFQFVELGESKAYDAVWRRFSRFQDTQRTTEMLMSGRMLPQSQKQNVRKQMQQLSYTIAQAKEFSDAARSGGDTTRALLAYYSITALANAEILWKGSGDDSFERRPSHFNGHGLELTRNQSLWDFAAHTLKRSNGSISGLFGLWYQYASHFPLYCTWTTVNGATSRTNLAAGDAGTPLRSLPPPDNAITLGECMRHIPSMINSIRSFGEQPKLARGQNEVQSIVDTNGAEVSRQIRYIIHPAPQQIFDDIISQYNFNSAMVENIDIFGLNNSTGVSIQIEIDTAKQPWQNWSLAEIFLESRNIYYIVSSKSPLNEFGYFYIGLYITGMLSRYYPQYWIKELREGSYITSLIQEFVEHSLHRVPMLALGQLEKTIFLYS
ncbi:MULTISPECIES: YaaC family protein [unclassified Rhizobium]|uniref:YaaC family protein n=1 Tax=unclassified Rhizobium TaxID=2613769 RepID=UPI0016174D92|nr:MULTISPECIES: YaaC family protein [unclassified Rhizobium]MBB3387176.1 hypothetical protein [Rhizobium sp. BK098]MBB3618888.1 hypothetical protein [Rhizobium sp. BK609]MBB3684536.1 hypothetical protein [Rhizobium sp. BK612]